MLEGLDHLLFLLTLVLVPTRFLRLVQIVTAFTVAHSLTLAIAWFEWVSFPSRWVEVLIAASIAYAAATVIGPGGLATTLRPAG